MLRWLSLSALLAVGVFVVVALAAPTIPYAKVKPPGDGDTPPKEGRPSEPEPPRRPDSAGPKPRESSDDKGTVVHDNGPAGTMMSQPLIIQDARLLSTLRVDVPTERDGKIVCLATPKRPGEVVAPDKLVSVELGFLAVEALGETVPENERLTFPEAPRRIFRRARETDALQPDHTVVARQRIPLRKLEVGDWVVKDQLLAVINPALTLDEMAIKVAKLDSAEADRRASRKYKEEAERKVAGMDRSRATFKGAISDDDYNAGLLAVEKYREEEISKSAAVRQSQKELSAAFTTLKMHEIRSGIEGVVKVLYKQSGEAVKNLEPILQIQNPNVLKVEGLVEVQDGQLLKRRLDRARKLETEANLRFEQARNRGDRSGMEAAKQAMAQAAELTQIIVEPSRPEPPRAVLRGHLHEINCVAVSRGPQPVIVSGSEDRTVRIWEPVPGQPRWHERYRLDHHAVVKTLACSPAGADKNYLVTGTSAGRLRRFNLEDLSSGETVFGDRHSGAVTCVTFSPDGKLVATGGDDLAICLWDVESGKLLHRISGAHKGAVTSLQFASPTQFVSAGDRRLVVWNLEEGKKPTQADEIDRRSGDVNVLGVSPDGKQVLYDEGRELRVLSLASHKIEGTLQNPTGAATFSTMALFSPDGRTILTNGSGAGRLQLWRTPSSTTSRASELRQFAWNSDVVTCGAFAPPGPDGRSHFAVTGTRDHQVVVWEMPAREELDSVLHAQLYFVEEFLDSSLRRVPVRAEMKKPDWVIPGSTATMVIPQRTTGR